MGVVTAIVSAMKGGSDPTAEDRRRAVAAAEADLAAENKRIADVEAAIEDMTARLRATDPDADPKTFAKLVGERDGLRGKHEAHLARAQRITAEFAEARAALAEAERAEKLAELEAIDAKARSLDAEMTGDARALDARLWASIRELRDLDAKATALERELGPQRPRRRHEPWRWVHAIGRGGLELAVSVLRNSP
jgi:hypothetical protein